MRVHGWRQGGVTLNGPVGEEREQGARANGVSSEEELSRRCCIYKRGGEPMGQPTRGN